MHPQAPGARERALTVILVPRAAGVTTAPIRTASSGTAGTADVHFADVRVPVGNTLGKEGKGLFVILRCALPTEFNIRIREPAS